LHCLIFDPHQFAICDCSGRAHAERLGRHPRSPRILLLLARFGKEGQPEKVIPKISQETLAEMVGTTRSRVSFFMNRFRKLGFIRYNGELEIHSSLLNVVLHDSPH
jgi:CRP-like cAMP-binding protein